MSIIHTYYFFLYKTQPSLVITFLLTHMYSLYIMDTNHCLLYMLENVFLLVYYSTFYNICNCIYLYLIIFSCLLGFVSYRVVPFSAQFLIYTTSQVFWTFSYFFRLHIIFGTLFSVMWIVCYMCLIILYSKNTFYLIIMYNSFNVLLLLIS